MYKLYIANEQTLNIKGPVVDINNWSFDIKKNWNGKYRFQDNKSIDFLLKADEKLYIYSDSNCCYIDTSNDAILFKREYLRYQNGRYEYENNQPRDIGVRLYCPKDTNITIKTSYNPAILENYKADDTPLNLNKKRVIRVSQAKSQLYYYLPPYCKSSFDINSSGTLYIQARAIFKASDILSKDRIKISIKVNSKTTPIEITPKASFDYIDDVNQTIVSKESIFSFRLPKKHNKITISSKYPILMWAKLYHDNMFADSLNLNWLEFDTNSFNIDRWRNSIRDGGLQRKRAILSQAQKLPSIERKKLQNIATHSTFFAPLEPSYIPSKSKYRYIYHSQNKLFADKNYLKETKLSFNQSLVALNSIKRDRFTTLSKPKKTYRVPTKRILGYIYTDDNSSISTQVSNLIQYISSKEKIILEGREEGIKPIKSIFRDLNISTKEYINKRLINSVLIYSSGYSKAPKRVSYHFDKLKYPRDIKIALYSDVNTTQTVTMYIDNHKTTLIYNPHSPFLKYTINPANNLCYPLDTIKILNNSKDGKLLSRVGVLYLTLPKGTKKLEFDANSHIAIALREEKSSIYKDDPKALAYRYKNSYKRFIKSLYSAIPKHFDSWYEHTHPLRLWILSQLSNVSKSIKKENYRYSEIKELIDRSKRYNDYLMLKQIAKSALFFTKDKKIRKFALDTLLKYSNSSSEKLRYYATYFVKDRSATALKLLADKLYTQGKIKLSLDCYLMLNRSREIKAKISQLSLLKGYYRLKRYIDSMPIYPFDRLIIDKRAILLSPQYRYGVYKAIDIYSNFGNSLIYSPSLDKKFYLSKCSIDRATTIHIDKPSTLEIQVRTTNLSPLRWLKIEIDNKEYLYPIVISNISNSLKATISTAQTLYLTIPKRATIRLFSDSSPLLISIKAKEALLSEIKPLREQLFKEHFIYKKPLSIGYISQLLQELFSKNQTKRFRAKIVGYLLSKKRDNYKYNRFIYLLKRGTKFSYISTIANSNGYYNLISKEPFKPISNIQKSRKVLLGDIKDYTALLYGNKELNIHSKGSEYVEIRAKEIVPKFFIKEPLKVLVRVDNNQSRVIELNSSKDSFNLKYHLTDCEHNIKISPINPSSIQYLGVEIFDNNKKVRLNSKKRYFYTSKANPISIDSVGPALFRVEELNATNEKLYYRFYLDTKLYRVSLPPTIDSNLSLIRVAKFQINRDYINRKYISNRVITPLLKKRLDILYSLPKAINNQEYNITLSPTYSLSLSSKSINISSEDSKKSSNKSVVEFSLSRRERLDKDSYLRNKFLVRFYDKPMVGLKNRLYTKLPQTDTYFKGSLDLYLQDRLVNLKAISYIFKKRKIDPNTTQLYGVGAFGYLMNKNKGDKEDIDPLVWSRYKSQHRYGLDWEYKLGYKWFDNLFLAYNLGVRTNENILSIDKIKQDIDIVGHNSDIDWRASYTNSLYLKDSDRDSLYIKNSLDLTLRYDKFIDTNRFELRSSIKYDIENRKSTLNLQGVFHFGSKQKYRYNFAPDEKLFGNIKNIEEGLKSETQ